VSDEINPTDLLTNPTEGPILLADMDVKEAAAVLGRWAGQQKSAKKAAAARENGKKGGRPRKGKSVSKPPKT